MTLCLSRECSLCGLTCIDWSIQCTGMQLVNMKLHRDRYAEMQVNVLVLWWPM